MESKKYKHQRKIYYWVHTAMRVLIHLTLVLEDEITRSELEALPPMLEKR